MTASKQSQDGTQLMERSSILTLLGNGARCTVENS
jgi:hypothetical protein